MIDKYRWYELEFEDDYPKVETLRVNVSGRATAGGIYAYESPAQEIYLSYFKPYGAPENIIKLFGGEE